MRFHTLRLLAVAGLCHTLSVAGDVVELPAEKDNTLYISAEGDLSNGSGNHMFAGRNGTGQTRRAVIKFDIESQVPAGAIVNDVALQLYMSMTPTQQQFVAMHVLLKDWGEGDSDASFGEGGGADAEPGDATWLHTFYDTDFWDTPGGDFVSASSAEIPVIGTGYYTWSSEQLAADVQSWIDNPGTNFGWILIGNESGAATAKRFDTHEIPAPEFAPVLTIDFTDPNAVDPVIIDSIPPDGAIDARQPFELDGSNVSGFQSVELFFDDVVEQIVADDFAITQTGGAGDPPGVLSLTPSGDMSLLLKLSAPINPVAWTDITHLPSATNVRLGYLPGDVSGDGATAVPDVLVLVDALNGQIELSIWSTDINRSGVANAADVLREIDLLNAVGAFPGYLGLTLPD